MAWDHGVSVAAATAPHAIAGQAVTGDKPRAVTESKLVALVVDPSVVGTEPVAPVRPGEIPAFEPPALKR